MRKSGISARLANTATTSNGLKAHAWRSRARARLLEKGKTAASVNGLARSGLALSALYPFSRIAIWFVVAFFVLGAIANLTTPSRGERLLWGPANVAMLLAVILIALSS